jgi:hypothetical protein
MSPLLVADGYAPELIAAGLAELTDPTRWFPSVALIAVSGRHP